MHIARTSSFSAPSLLVLIFYWGAALANPPTSLPGLRVRQQASNTSQPNTTAPNRSGICSVSLADDGYAIIHRHSRRMSSFPHGTYYTVVQAGRISFRASIDTGSSDFWLVSTACSTETCSVVPKYPLAYASPTFVSVNDNETAFSLSYADGTDASGFVARESVEVSNVTVPGQAFGLVTNSNVTLVDDISGVLGLGFSRLSEIYAATPDAPPFLASLSQQGILDYPIFGLLLTQNSTGSLALGAIDASVVQDESQIVWNEVVPFSPVGTQTNTSGYMYWAIHMTSFAVNGSSLTPIPTYPGPTENSSVALLDVGTIGLYGPYQDVTRLYALFHGSRLVDESGQWAIPCSSSATMTFSFGDGTAFVLQPTDYMIGPTTGNPSLCLSWPRASPPSTDGIDWQLGTPFLRTVYSIWSYGIDYVQPPMIGLYALSNTSTVDESPALVASFFSSVSATVGTILPNFPLATPTYTTPPYALNTSIPAYLGEIVDSELATSTYPPIPTTPVIGATALPEVSDQYTLTATNSQGETILSTYHLTEPSVILGVPPGWSGTRTLRVPVAALGFSFLVAMCAGVRIL